MNDYRIRMASLEDSEAIQAIYEPYILNTAITFEYEPISSESFKKRMEDIMLKFPWLVYELEGRIVGYAYCSRFKERAAFDWDCECSVYVDEQYHHRGIATSLYRKLFDLVKQQGYYNIYALIEYTHESSIALHKNFGFIETGVYRKTGYKLGKWWDLMIMEKRLQPLDESPKKIKGINEIEVSF